MNAPHKPRWRSRLTGLTRAALDATETWLNPIGWQSFCCLRFPHEVGEQLACARVKEFLNLLEKTLGSSVGALWCVEGQTRSGTPTPWHVHMALAAELGVVPASVIEEVWRSTVGQPRMGDVNVTPFDASRAGIAYILKASGERACWDLHRLDRFLPDSCWSQSRSHAANRGRRRLLRLRGEREPSS